VPLTQLTRKIGAERAARAWRRSRLAVESIAGVLHVLGVPDVARRDTLYLAGSALDRDALRRESEARRAVGLESTFLDRAALHERFGVHHSAASLNYGNLVADPRKTTFALLADAIAHGAALYEKVDIVDVAATTRSVTATTKRGQRILARHLVFATGYELPKCLPRRGHKVVSTWAIATPPQRDRLWPGEVTMWEASEPYLYVRTTPEGRVICGGEDEEFPDAAQRDAAIPRKSRVLQKKLHRLLPALDTRIEFAWAGAFGQSATGLPRIGEIPGMPHCWAALGFGGNGITYARLAAEVIRGALTGHPDRDAGLYAFPRA
jgi:glycine/D-amino acid oxidase-like deaminating enzyme